MTDIEDNFDAFRRAEQIGQLDFSHLTEDDFADIQYDEEDGTPYGMVQGVPVAINTQPPVATPLTAPQPAAPPDPGYDKVGSDIVRGLVTGAHGAGKGFNQTLGMLAGAPVDLAIENEKLREARRQELAQRAAQPDASLDTRLASAIAEFGSYIPNPIAAVSKGIEEGLRYFGLDSGSPLGGSESIRDALSAVVNFGSSLIPDEARAAGERFAAEKPQSPLIQSIVNEAARIGLNGVSPALYLRAFTVMTPLARGLAWGGIADFINAQPDEESAISELTKFLSGAEEEDRSAFANAALTVLQRNNNDPEFINKARVALDGMVIGGTIEKTLEGAGYVVRAVKSGALRQAIVDAGAGADRRLSGMRDTLSANPVSGGVDVALSAAGKLADRRRVGTTGQYIGAPPGVKSPQKLAALRNVVSNLAREGTQGRFWYEESSKAILEAVGGDIAEADKLIQAIAVLSPTTPVKHNLDYALQAYAQWKAGQPILTGKFPVAMSEKLTKIFNGEDWAGRKTDDFYNNLMIHIDPARTGPVTGDIWMLRAFGFTKPNEMPSPRQYQFITEETQRIAQELGWEPHQVQAAIWVTMKGRSENPAVKAATEKLSEKKGWIKFEINKRTGKKERKVVNPTAHMQNWLKHALKHDLTADDIERAKFDYADAMKANRGQISWESIPGRTSNHMPQMFNAPYAQQAEYHVAVSKAFLDANGDDIIAKRLGLLSPGDFEAPGFFQGKVSPGSQTMALMPRQYKGAAAGDIEQSSQDLVAAYAAVRGILMKQDGVGWHRPFYKAKKRDENGIVLRIGRPFSAAETKRLGDIMADLAGHGEYNPVAAEDGVRLLNFDFVRKVPDGEGGFKPAMDGTWIDEDKLLTNEEFGKLVDEAVRRLELDDDLVVDPVNFQAYTGYSGNDWSVNPNGEDYYAAISGQGRSDLQRRVRDLIRELQPRVDEIDQDFSERYGWTINKALNAIHRGIDDVTSPPID